MRRKRFKHQVYVFCHMFCGWQLVNDFEELEKLHSGVIEIDVKNGKCEVDGVTNDKLTMPLVLNDWLLRDMAENDIQLSDIDEAHLTVSFDMKDFGSKNGEGPEFNCYSYLISSGNKYSLKFKGENKGINEVNVT